MGRKLKLKMANLFFNQHSEDFWVWVNPDNWLVKHQITVTGGFTSGGLIKEKKSNLMFIPNPEFEGDISAFHHGITRDYLAEYNLEQGRERYFTKYPSRLNAIYLFKSEEEAYKYNDRHKWHVGDRKLKKCYSKVSLGYSIHDLSWVDFLRLPHSVDVKSLDYISRAYWSGQKVEDSRLESMGKPWIQKPIFEVLFLGRVEFYDRNI